MDLRLVIVGIALRQLFHGLGIGLNAGAVIDFIVVGVHDREGIDVVALALGLGADALSLGDRRGPLGDILRGGATWDFTKGSSRCPNKRCRTRGRPSAHLQSLL